MKTVATLGLMLLGWTLGVAQNVPANAVPSSKHYRESGVGNATGRSGSATMTARALLSKDGSATIELTTGTLDMPNPPGSFAKVQFKPLDQSGNALFATNFAPLSTPTGYYSFEWPSLHRSEQVQLQGNIRGIDRSRTDVVTVAETVKLRPDLAVSNLTVAPNPAFTNQAVNISATIAELNGDASATTTCELFVYQGSDPGSPVDQANNVYVDAGGSVSCTFSYSFSAPGTYTILVKAANVVPGDWDWSNNSASTTVTVHDPAPVQSGAIAEHADAYFTNFNYSDQYSNSYETWNSSGAVVENYFGAQGFGNRWQESHANFESYGCVGATNATTWNFPANVAITETMDGSPVYSFSDNGVTGYSYQVPVPPGGFGTICNANVASVTAQMGSDFASDHWQYLESYRYYDAGGTLLWIHQLAHSERYSSDVTYFSNGYQCNYWWATSTTGTCVSASDYYTWNDSSESLDGSIVSVGNTWNASLMVQDSANNLFSGNISVPLVGSPYNSVVPYTCSNTGPDVNGYTYESCSSSNLTFGYTSGSASQ